MADYEDINYDIDGPTAVITIDRPQRYNAFRGRTVEELIAAFRSAWADAAVQAIILTGAGEKTFCTGNDVKQRAETGDRGLRSEREWDVRDRQPAQADSGPSQAGRRRCQPRPCGPRPDQGTGGADLAPLRGAIEAGIASGLISAVDIDLVVFDLMMLAHGWALEQWHFAALYTVDSYVRAQLGLLLRSLLVPQSQDGYRHLLG